MAEAWQLPQPCPGWVGWFSPELGHYSLALCCALGIGALVVLLASCWVPPGRQQSLGRLARLAMVSQSGACFLACACLAVAAWGEDYSTLGVFMTAAPGATALLYRLAGLWSSPEGALLLQCAAMASVTLLWLASWYWGWVGRTQPTPPTCSPPETHRPRSLANQPAGQQHPNPGGTFPSTLNRIDRIVCAVLSLLVTALAMALLLAANPFRRLWPPPAGGVGLNPLLEHPFIAFHPPLLAEGWALLAVPWGLAIALLLMPRRLLGPATLAYWGKLMQRWALGAWLVLTAAITTGSWWAYGVMGWGGYWFWDPVENMALLPWLSALGLFHAAQAGTNKPAGLRSLTVLLALLGFGTALLGMMLSRSGLLASVHSFNGSGTKMALGAVGAPVLGSLLLYAFRAPRLPGGQRFAPFSQGAALALCAILCCLLAGLTLLGTLYPVLWQALGGMALGVGGAFFTSTERPVLWVMLLAMALVPALGAPQPGRWLVVPALVGMALGALCLLWGATGGAVALTVALAGTLLVSGLQSIVMARLNHQGGAAAPEGRKLSAQASLVAHTGVAIAVLGMCGMAMGQHRVWDVSPGATVRFQGQAWHFDGLETYRAGRALVTTAHFSASNGAALAPERRDYSTPRLAAPGENTSQDTLARGPTISHPARLLTGRAMVRLSLGAPLPPLHPGGVPRWTVEFRREPCGSWLWAGAALMMAGGLMGLVRPRRHLPACRTTPATASGEGV
ncbi:hypothetical protein E3E12_05625 [Formicincola oecophyllae]|uniref:Heme lyase CcmF/NrfE family subunit n=1 Tax=Formicincola oecophyllae TaxID=2558361 RepID=A0A4Y6UBH9_9PROT|nr:cytochrome c-type biogenesis CcmF C-terminal domain-containing protein [Formicincola oecophyllae]QDH13751.1 hypothetical protein E3E12_05625 [Formicincola oecophyllae]